VAVQADGALMGVGDRKEISFTGDLNGLPSWYSKQVRVADFLGQGSHLIVILPLGGDSPNIKPWSAALVSSFSVRVADLLGQGSHLIGSFWGWFTQYQAFICRSWLFSVWSSTTGLWKRPLMVQPPYKKLSASMSGTLTSRWAGTIRDGHHGCCYPQGWNLKYKLTPQSLLGMWIYKPGVDRKVR
jgi:hypothetical protein